MYAEDQMTPWFSGKHKPVRSGSYQVKLLNSPEIVDGWYEGGFWQIGFRGKFSRLSFPPNQFQWRGLNSEPPAVHWTTPIVFTMDYGRGEE